MQAWLGIETDGLDIVVDHIDCTSNELRILTCADIGLVTDCDHGGGARVRCRDERLRVRNVNSTTVSVGEYNEMYYTVILSWELYSNATHSPTLFIVACSNQQLLHRTELSMINGTLMQISVGGLLSHAAYNCCVSPMYYYAYGRYIAERKCTLTEIPRSDSFTMPASTGLDMFVSSDLNMRVTITGGVLGFIIAILLVLLVICGGALLYLLRSRRMIPKR